MKQYKEYKDSGIAWIGAIPSHWQVVKMKYIFSECSEKGYPNEPILCSTQKYGVIPQSLYENRVVVVNKGLDGLKRVLKGDFVISLRSFQGGIEYAHYQGIISAAYTILRIVSDINPEYLRILMKSHDFIQLLQTCVTGIREGQNINYSLLRNKLLPLPPKEEQEAIVEYLDKKTEQINQYIRLQEQQIQGLQELKQSIIARAVTRGLDPKAPLRPSGIAWIGDIPCHWQVKRLGSLAKVRTGTTPTSTDLSYYDGDILWFTPSDFSKDGITLSSSKRTLSLQAITENKITLFPANSVLMIGIGATLGRIGITNTPSYSNQQINAIIPGNRIIAQYTAYWLLSNKSSIWVSANSATLPILNQEKTKNLPILLPPVEEQEAIVKYLDEKTEQINLLISKTEASIALMKEFKQSLIADAVTGRINVQPA